MTDTGPSSAGFRLVLVLALWGAGLAGAAQFAKISVILEELAALYPGAGMAEGFLLSLISLVGVIFGVTGGTLVARLGSRSILVGALALGAALSVMQAMIPPLPVMLALRCAEGFSHLGIVVAAPTLIAGLSEGRWQGAAMTLWGSFFGVAFALTALLGRPLVAALGVPAMFLAHGAAMLGFALVLWSLLPDPPRHASGTARGGPLSVHVAIYQSPFLSAPALGWLFYTLTFVAVMAVLPRFLSGEDRAFALSAMPVAGIAVSMTVGVYLLRRMRAVGVVVLGFGLSAAMAGGFALFGADPLVAIGLFAMLGLIQGASFAAVPQLNPTVEGRALANGAVAQMGNTGNLLGTPVLLWLVRGQGLDGLIWFAVAAYVLGGCVHLIQAARRGGL